MDTPLLSNLQREVVKRSSNQVSAYGISYDRDRHDPYSRKDDRKEQPRERKRERHREKRRRRSATPEPTIVVPLHNRVSRSGAWDKVPPGCEGMTVKQVKNSGLFPLPGQPAKNTYLAATGGLTGLHGYNPEVFGTLSAMGAAGIKANRKLYVGNINGNMRELALTDALNDLIKKGKIMSSSSIPVVSADINKEKNYAIVMFRTMEDADAALALDGMKFDGRPIEVRRPKEGEDMNAPISNVVAESVNKIFIGSLPVFLNEDQVMELLKAFGDLKSFNLIKDSNTGISKGFAFCEYVDPEVSDVACQGLNGMEIGDKKLIVQRASATAAAAFEVEAPQEVELPMLPIDILQSMVMNPAPPTKILLLLNMVCEEDLVDDLDYEGMVLNIKMIDIYGDIMDECSKYGKVEKILIPRPSPIADKEDVQYVVPGVGKIFIVFSTVEEAVEAQKKIAGRQYNDRAIITAFFDEGRFERGEI